ncbi:MULTISPECIES: DUF3097 domain-containing protein [unclassified Frigoribacterium]|uniref:DUF3097 domain-containing protein n=1 Tax=unclassified Frigoribacterium TaxID=2627005 RepID=UPI0007023347|nr:MULTISPECIES: DUF3097 domain-containing protein [unclassified Frigoribacterium]KQO47480.1 hypothetical protein ASF07_08125 [Frigoribacterium sp. Leaf254]KQT39573.1 hypothetical protein ASG28_08130 [Frigoribacterium sp. Leaf415]
MDDDRYGADVLAGDWKRSSKPAPTPTDAVRDLVVEEVRSGFTGAIVRVEAGTVELEDWKGRVRAFPMTGSFLIDGAPVALRVPRAAPQGRARTASGSFAVEGAKARVARQSRIFVEGRHDAELVEKVWGSDLRVEGVVVEYLEGVDHLADVLRDFRPGPERRVGVLVDHLVPGSKESRVAEGIARSPLGRHVLVVGHPFVDVWQAVKPARLGIDAWPVVPRSVEWKHGVCEAMGWPHEDQADIARAWQHILSRVRSYADLEPSVLGRVEELIDFVTSG